MPEGEAEASAGSSQFNMYRWVLLGGIWFVYFCFGLVATSMAPLIPAISTDLKIGNALMGAIFGAWPLVYIGAAIPCGILLDWLKPRSSLFLGSAMVALSALMRGLAWDEPSLFLAVALFGIGGPLISIGAPKLVAQWFAGRDRGFAVGVYITGPALGGAAALAMTTSFLMPIMDQDWRMVMFAYAGISLASGVVWFAIASHSLAAAIAGGHSDRDRFSIQMLWSILAMPAVRIILAMGIGVFFVNHGVNNWLPELLREKGLGAVEAGMWASVVMIAGIFGSLLVPRYVNPEQRLVALAAIFITIAGSSFLLLLPAGAFMGVPLILLGIARTSATAVIMLLLFELPGISSARHGLLGGIFFVAAEIGGVLGPLTIGVLSQNSDNFDTSLLAIVVVSLVLIALVGLLVRLNDRNDGIE